jgi:hypothetical protein
MRNYWLKILGGAFGIFAVGMLLITAFRGVRSKVTSTLNSSDPIPIPLVGLVPFRLDDARLGSLSRLEFLRSDPEHVSGVRVLVKLVDSVGPERLSSCQLTVDNVEGMDERTTFRCVSPGGDLSGLEPFGTVVIKGSGDSFPLLLPSKTVAELRGTTIRFDHDGVHVEGPRKRLGTALAARTDSIREALDRRIDARADSVDALRDEAEGLEDSSTTLGSVERRGVQRSADSVRAAMRAMVDRMKADESRLKALDEVAGLTPEEIDSLSRLGTQIRDSVRQAVARELQRVQAEVRRLHEQQLQVEVPAPPAAKPQ